MTRRLLFMFCALHAEAASPWHGEKKRRNELGLPSMSELRANESAHTAEHLESAENMAAFVITEEVTPAQIAQLQRLGIARLERISPRKAMFACVDESRGATGCAFAHQAAWEAIAALGRRALVLEADFSIGNQDEAEVKRKLQAAFLRHDDWTSVGYCGQGDCPGERGSECGGDNYDAGPLQCMTGYILNPETAGRLAKHDVCEPTKLKEGGFSRHAPPIDWYLDHVCEVKQITCYFAAGPNAMQGHYGQGIIQQDERHGGMHKTNHEGETAALQPGVPDLKAPAGMHTVTGETSSTDDLADDTYIGGWRAAERHRRQTRWSSVKVNEWFSQDPHREAELRRLFTDAPSARAARSSS